MDGRSAALLLGAVLAWWPAVRPAGWSGAAHASSMGSGPEASPSPAGVLRPELLWEAATGPIRRGSEISVVEDVSGDGASDVLVAERTRRGPSGVVLIDGASGRELWKRRFRRPSVPPNLWPDPRRGPCVLAAHGDTLSVIDARAGSVVRATRLRAPIGEIVIARLDADDTPDVVYSAGRERDDLLVALAGVDFSELWATTAAPDDSRFGVGFTALTACDLDRDGADEILVSENMQWVIVLTAGGGTLWRRELGERTTYVPNGGVSGAPVLADFLGGGAEQLAIGLWAGALVVVDPSSGDVLGRRVFGADSEAHRRAGRNRRLPRFLRAILAEAGEPINEMLAVDLDGRPGREVVFGCSDGYVYAYSPHSNRVLWRSRSRGQVYSRPLALDADGDDMADVFAWDEDGAYLLSGTTGLEIAGCLPGAGVSGAVLADLEHDGAVELIELGPDGSLRAFTTGLACARAPGAPGCGR
jgi:hypothetical protein